MASSVSATLRPSSWLIAARTCCASAPGRRELRCLRAQPLFLLAQFGRELGAEIGGIEHLANFDHRFLAGHRIGTALDPFDRLVLRLALPQPEARDQLLRLGERSVDL